jgi:hypothetical protein
MGSSGGHRPAYLGHIKDTRIESLSLIRYFQDPSRRPSGPCSGSYLR